MIDTYNYDLFNVTADDTPPVITGCPVNDTSRLAPGSSSTTFSWKEPTVFDNDGILSVINSHNQSDLFYAGETVVTYVATDNSFNTATCSFTLTVQGDFERFDFCFPLLMIFSTP